MREHGLTAKSMRFNRWSIQPRSPLKINQVPDDKIVSYEQENAVPVQVTGNPD
jgi:hypothetical protein